MLKMINVHYSIPINHQQIFKLLVVYRWISLIPVLVTFNPDSNQSLFWTFALLMVILVNITITWFPEQLNTLLARMPWLFLVDILICASVFLVGGWETPYYFYAVSPLLAAAFFFGLRGAIPMAGIMSLVYIIIGILTPTQVVNLAEMAARVVGFFLIAGTVGYTSLLLKNLQITHSSLHQVHRNLEAIHTLTNSLQSAADIHEVQERVLSAITEQLGFSNALIGLVDQEAMLITNWLYKSVNHKQDVADALHNATISLKRGGEPIIDSILQAAPQFAVQNLSISSIELAPIFNHNSFHIFPMILREHPVGVILISGSENEQTELIDSLKSITSQAALAVGTTMLCIDRAKRLAVQEERVRIAREIHDTLSQSLFGLSFALDACVKLLPANPERVKEELVQITQLAEKTRRQIRQSIMDIWPTEITAETFAHDLNQYAYDFCYCDELDLTIRVRGPFQQLSSRTKRGLYRVAQEGLANIIRHSAASEALVCLTVLEEEAGMIIRDNGRGFDIVSALRQERQPEHFGISGIQERVESLNGFVEFLSQSEVGTAILIMVPTEDLEHYG